jgi:hypothetical protein
MPLLPPPPTHFMTTNRIREPQSIDVCFVCCESCDLKLLCVADIIISYDLKILCVANLVSVDNKFFHMFYRVSVFLQCINSKY